VNRRAIVVGAGPNGLVAAITLARAGWAVTVYEAAARAGGGTRSEELTVPGAIHDVCSAIHPLAVGSPAFREIAAGGALGAHGLEWIHSEVPLAHPLDGGRAAVLCRSVDETASALGTDASAYRRLFGPFVDAGFELTDGLLSPLTVPPKHPLTMARFGAVGILPAHTVAKHGFDTDEAQGLFAVRLRARRGRPRHLGPRRLGIFGAHVSMRSALFTRDLAFIGRRDRGATS